MARSFFEEGQDVCDAWPDAWVSVPTPLRQHPDIFRETENLSVLRPRGSPIVKDKQRHKDRVNVGERLFLCENL